MMEQALRLFENLGFKVVAYNPETYILYERKKEIEAEPKNFMIKKG